MFWQEEERREAANWLKWIADTGAMAVAPVMRTRFGQEGIGMAGARAALLILGWAGLGYSEPLLYYFGLWLLCCCWQRAKTERLVRRGWVEHSRYNGWPWLVMKLLPPLKSERSAKLVFEPLLWLGVAVGISQVPGGESAGNFFAFCALCLFVSGAIDTHIDQMRLRRMRDAQLEQQQLADWYRNGRLY
jgi:hypothetical protein